MSDNLTENIDTTNTAEQTQDLNVDNFEPYKLPGFVVIDNKEYKISSLTAKKTAFIMNLLGKLLISGKLKLKEFAGVEARDLPVAILMAVDEKSLISLAAILINESEKFVEENFSLTWVLEALAIQIEVGELDKIVRNFTLVVSQIA